MIEAHYNKHFLNINIIIEGGPYREIILYPTAPRSKK